MSMDQWLTISRLFCSQIGEFRTSPKDQRQLRRLSNAPEAVLSHAVEERRSDPLHTQTTNAAYPSCRWQRPAARIPRSGGAEGSRQAEATDVIHYKRHQPNPGANP